MKFLCDKCKAKYQIADEKVAGRTVRMKCRKCGHLIEVRAEVTETSVATKLPKEPEPPPATREAKPPESTGTGETNTPTAFVARAVQPALAEPRPVQPVRPPQPSTPLGSLAGAFRTAVEREEEPSSPLDMADLRAADEWYVAINGVPVGPILVAEVRRKAALGSVTEDTLVWQDGLDEWRPVRSFPELAATVREAAHAGRGSLVPPAPPSRGTARLSPDRSPAVHAVPQAPLHPPAPPPQAPAPAPPASSVQRPIALAPHAPTPQGPHPLAPAVAPEQTGAAAPAESPPPAPRSAEVQPASVSADPFKVPAPPFVGSSAANAQEPLGRPVAARTLDEAALRSLGELDLPPARGTPWVAIAMVAAAMAFGSTAAIVLLLPRASQPAQPESALPAAATMNPQNTMKPGVAGDPSDRPANQRESPSPSSQAEALRRPVASAPPRPQPMAAATASASSRAFDTHSFIPPSAGVIPTDDTTESPKAPGQCQSEGQVQQVIAQHQTAIRRTCWERNQTEKPAASVAVALTIAPDGSPQGVSVTGDDPMVARCIEGDLHSWHFPAMGCSQKTAFSLKFVRQ